MKKIFPWILLFTVLAGCKKSDQDVVLQGPAVVFVIDEVGPSAVDTDYASWDCPAEVSGLKAKPVFAEVIINGITYRPAVYRNNGQLYTETIKLEGHRLETTLCTVTHFVLKAANGLITDASPEKDAAYAGFVNNALPFHFVIKGNSKVTNRVEVICFLPENQSKYGFTPVSIREIVVREKSFFGDVCVVPSDYVGSDYENQTTGLQVDMPAIVEIVLKKDGLEVAGSPFTNATNELGWGVGQPLIVQYPDDVLVDGEIFTFELSVLVADGQGGFAYQLFHTFTAIDDGPLDVYDLAGDGIIDFVLGECVFNDPDNPTTDLEIPWDPLSIRCESAFARSGTHGICFIDLVEINSNRWGWTNGPFQENIRSAHFLIYAGAAKCDVSKGTLVGSLSVDYQGGEATVSCTMDNGYSLNEIHWYVGTEILPRDKHGNFTVSPGQYPHINEDLNGAEFYTNTFTGLSGEIYVVAHAVVCGVFPVE